MSMAQVVSEMSKQNQGNERRGARQRSSGVGGSSQGGGNNGDVGAGSGNVSPEVNTGDGGSGGGGGSPGYSLSGERPTPLNKIGRRRSSINLNRSVGCAVARL
jgi:hypothetical protein